MTSSIPWKTIVIKISVSLGMLSSNIRNSWSVSFFIIGRQCRHPCLRNVQIFGMQYNKFCRFENFTFDIHFARELLFRKVRVEKDAVFERIDRLWKTNLIPRKFSRLFIVYGGQMRGAFRKLCIITNAMP